MKNEIKCPNCGEVFTVNESDYAAILSEVRTKEFDEEISKREESIRTALKAENDLALEKASQANKDEVSKLNEKIAELKSSIETEKQKAINDSAKDLCNKELEIQKLQNQITLNAEKSKSEKQEAIRLKEDEITKLNQVIEKLKGEKELEKANSENDKLQAVQKKEEEIKVLNERIEQINKANEIILKEKDDTISYYKDLKAKLNNKMIGEELEVHCQTSFNNLRPLFNSTGNDIYFEKDNDASEGTKGDFIYREVTKEGVEVLSIMFEMKNQNEETKTKHKNEDFFDKLDKDRNKKNCEYAVLVSLLEEDSEYYNGGIVDVSHIYDKMYVIRPQFFIPIITILRNAAMNSLKYKNELQEMKNENLDISKFEDRMNEFKDKFGKNVGQAKEKFDSAIKEIDKSIEALKKVKENLLGSSKKLEDANEKAQELTIKKLTYGLPLLKEKFEEEKSEDKSND